MPRSAPLDVPLGVPVVRRPDGSVQIGSSPRSAVHVTGSTVTQRTGTQPGPGPDVDPGSPDPPDEALAWAAYDPDGRRPAARMRGRARSLVAVAGSPVVADVLLDLLVEAGVGGVLSDRPRRGTSTARRPADLVVLVHDHVSRVTVADGLMTDGVPHLSVVLRDTDAVVGPLVVPGRSACLRCVDRRHTAADPHWPAVRDALAAAPRRPVDAATARAVAGLATLQVLAHLDGVQAGAVGAWLELLLPEGRVRQRWWRPHPACGCVDLPVPS